MSRDGGKLLEDGLRTDADPPVVRHVSPLHDAPAVEDEHGRSRDVAAFHARPFVSEAVRVDGNQIRIGENRKLELQLLDHLSVFVNRIDADGQNVSVGFVNRLNVGLQTLQFRETERSPEAAVKDEDHFPAAKAGQAHRLAVVIEQREIGSGLLYRHGPRRFR